MLQGAIAAIGRGPDLERVLPAIVELLTTATHCHACFVYIVEAAQLRLRAASRVFAHLVGQITFGVDEGLAGWVVRHRAPAFIRENALADPRIKLVPELHEERFQSMIAVPLERENEVIGVVVLHTEAPHEFSKDVVDLLTTVATVVSGAVDNARLYEESRTQIEALNALTVLSRSLATVTRSADISRVLEVGMKQMLQASETALHTKGAATGRLVHDPAAGRIAVAVRSTDGTHGVISVSRKRPFRVEHVQLVEAVAVQLALAIERLTLIDELRGDLHERDVFTAIDSRTTLADPSLLATPFSAVVVEPPLNAERRLRAAFSGVICDTKPARLRALVPLNDTGTSPIASILQNLDRGPPARAGFSAPYADPSAAWHAMRDAERAARLAPVLQPNSLVQDYAELGAYSFLAGIDPMEVPHQRYSAVARILAQYDLRRNAELVETLERYLQAGQGIAPTARRLGIHPNTLRQRLARIESLAGLNLNREDSLSLLLALKLNRLRASSDITEQVA